VGKKMTMVGYPTGAEINPLLERAKRDHGKIVQGTLLVPITLFILFSVAYTK
jgi:hypothetical protein